MQQRPDTDNFKTSADVKDRITQKNKLTELLKESWYSYTDMIIVIRAGEAGRRFREIRKNPPEGFKIIERKITREKKSSCKEFKIVEV
jgi:hypothetical protein